jgi:hypothetical protein
VAADKNDDPGVLGNLPRSRPGHRSDKRGGRGTGAKPAKARAAKAPSASATASARAARPARRPQSEPEAPRPRVEADQHRGDPLSAAVHLAGKVAEAGLKTAGDLLRRLPGR